MSNVNIISDDEWRKLLPPGRFVVTGGEVEIAHQSALRDEFAYLDDEYDETYDADLGHEVDRIRDL